MGLSKRERRDLKKRISEIMTKIDKKTAELDFMTNSLREMSSEDYVLMMSKASGSLERRAREGVDGGSSDNYYNDVDVEALIQEKIRRMEEERIAKAESLDRLWNKLYELQQEERELEGLPRID
ncbi:hypothetical protein SPBR_05413 [Sporothrix brasiliensis 5110]|uniref:Uncharacterized protein n=1 Tax=Sporothrix brasiliensis 5110 TaxID=1398154 RepID=A0A0C2IRY7_9PEZI|nr:uncharacterized protein SPBR_05413 [Sporothrix brasiliensis 5110]KIH87767.1 hypothetical protein SPBR_05413 [Sporothrix brasiliensis 5110]